MKIELYAKMKNSLVYSFHQEDKINHIKKTEMLKNAEVEDSSNDYCFNNKWNGS